MEQELRYFPTICVDNFFDDANIVREFALQQEFFKSPEGLYPGKRTKYLDELSEDYYGFFCEKLASIFYDLRTTKVHWKASVSFQLIEPYEDTELNKGWVHQDNNALLGGIVYLNKTSQPNSGTSVCDIKDGEEFDWQQSLKHRFNQGKITNIDYYKERLKAENDKFVDTITFQNKFNRMVCFDGTTYHRVDNFDIGSEPRLTLVFFIHEIDAPWFPLHIP